MLKSFINNAVQLDIMQHFLQLLQSMSSSATQAPQGPTNKEETQKEGMISIDEIALTFIARAQNILPGETPAAAKDAEDYFLSYYESQSCMIYVCVYRTLQERFEKCSGQISETQKLLNCLNLLLFNLAEKAPITFSLSNNDLAELLFKVLQDYFKALENPSSNKAHMDLYARVAAKLANQKYIAVTDCQALSPLVQAYLDEEALDSIAERFIDIIIESQLDDKETALTAFVATTLPTLIARKQECTLAQLVLDNLLQIEAAAWDNIVQLQLLAGTVGQAEVQEHAACEMLDTNTIILYGLSFLLENIVPKNKESLPIRIRVLQTLYEHADTLFRIAIKLHAQNAVEIGKNETVKSKIYYAYEVLKSIENEFVAYETELKQFGKQVGEREIKKNFKKLCANYPEQYISRTVQMADYVDRLESHEAACKLLDEASQRYMRLPKKAPKIVSPAEWSAKLNSIKESLDKKRITYQKHDTLVFTLNRLYRLALDGTTRFQSYLTKDPSKENHEPSKKHELQERLNALTLSCRNAKFTNNIEGFDKLFTLLTEIFRILDDITQNGSAADNKQFISQVAMLMISVSKVLRDLNSGFVIRIMIEMFQNLARYCFELLKSMSTPESTSAPQAQLGVAQQEISSTVVDAIFKDIAQLSHTELQSRYAEVVLTHFKKINDDAILTHCVSGLIAKAKQDALDDVSIDAIYKIKKDIMLARCLTDNILPQFLCLASFEHKVKDFHCLRNAEFMLRVRTKFEKTTDFKEADVQLLQDMKEIYLANLVMQTNFQSGMEAELKTSLQEFNADKQYAYFGLLGFYSNFLRACCFASDFETVVASLPNFKESHTKAQRLIGLTKSCHRSLAPNAAKFFESISRDLSWIEVALKAIQKNSDAYVKKNKKVIVSHDIETTVVISSPPEIIGALLKRFHRISPEGSLEAFELAAEFYEAQIRIYNQRAEVLKTYITHLRSVIAPYGRGPISSFETYFLYMDQIQTNFNVATFLLTHLARRHDERFPSSKVTTTILELMVNALDTHVKSLSGLLNSQQLPYGSYAQSFEQFKNLFMLFHTQFLQEYQQETAKNALRDQKLALKQLYAKVQLVAQQFSDMELAQTATLAPVVPAEMQGTRDENFVAYTLITSQREKFSKLLKHFANVAKAKNSLQTSTPVAQDERDLQFDSLTQFWQSLSNYMPQGDLASKIAIATKIKACLANFHAQYKKLALPITFAICEQLDQLCSELDVNLEKMSKRHPSLQTAKVSQKQQSIDNGTSPQPKQVASIPAADKKATSQAEHRPVVPPKAANAKLVFRDPKRQQKEEDELQEDEYSYEKLLARQLEEDALERAQSQQGKKSRQEKKAKKEEAKKRLELEKQAQQKQQQEQAEKAEQLKLEALKRKQQQAEKEKCAQEKKRLAAQRKAVEEAKYALAELLKNELIDETVQELIAEMAKLELSRAQQEQERKQRYVSSVAALSDLLSSTHISAQQQRHCKMLSDEDFKIRTKLALPPRVQAIFKLFKEANIKIYCYGGFVRDGLLGHNNPKGDFDFVAFCTPEEAKKILGINCVAHNRYPNQLALEHDIDISCTTKTLTEFAQKLDITQNAMFTDADGQCYDPLLVFSTLKRNELNPIGDPMIRFAEDPVKMYRIIRQSNQLKRPISLLGQQALFTNLSKLSTLSFSDYRREMSKLLLAGNAISNLRTVFAFNAMVYIFPMLANIDLQNGYIQDWLYSQLNFIDALDSSSRTEQYSVYMVFAILLAPVVFYEIFMIQKLNKDVNLTINVEKVISATVNNFYSKFHGYQASILEVQALAHHLKSYHRLLNQHHIAYSQHLQKMYSEQQGQLQQQNVSDQANTLPHSQPQALVHHWRHLQQQRAHSLRQPPQQRSTSTKITAVPFKY